MTTGNGNGNGEISGRVTLRDVLDLVRDSEQRLNDTFREGFERIETIITVHDADIKTLKESAAQSRTVRQVVRVSFTGVRNIVVMAVAVIGGVSGLVALLRG